MRLIELSLVILVLGLFFEHGSAQDWYHRRPRNGLPPRGFARQTLTHYQQSGWDEAASQNKYPPFDKLEYGGLRSPQFPQDSNEDIEQVSRNEDLSDFSQQQNNLEDDDIPLPPRYVQTTTARTSTAAPPASSPSAGVDSPEAVTPKGTFRGKKEVFDGKGVYEFYGVPYAKPPIKELRFRRPVPYEPTEEVIDATQLPDACSQMVLDVFNGFAGEAMYSPNTNTSEDCLYVNIWVPESAFDEKEEKLVPVLFWIHGGGFFSGSSSMDVYNGAKFAASQGIIVVGVQYRLGPLGFLFLEPGQGNFGLFDQALALQWTHKNIEYFGGNPNMITAAGESCGSASVGYHLVSPISKGFIKRGMMTSGLPTEHTYPFNSCDQARENSFALARDVGCNQQNSQEILECLRNTDVDKLITAQWKSYKHMMDFPFTPVIDGTFLSDHPEALLMKGKAKRADLLVGTVENEGTFFLLYHYINYMSHLKPTSVTYDRYVEIMNELFYDFSEVEREAIIDMYTNWENPEDGYANQRNIGEAVGDGRFVCPHRKFANGWSNRGLSVYYYHISQRLASSPWPDWMGVLHGDDIAFLFGPLSNWTLSESEKASVENFQTMVANFVREGVPSRNWERYSTENPVYLDVNATKVSDTSTPDLHGPHAKACAFWNKHLPSLATAGACQAAGSGFSAPVQTCGHSQPPPFNLPYPSQPGFYLPSVPPPQNLPPKNQACSHEPVQTTEPPVSTSTSTSCKCTVEEGPTSTTPLHQNTPGFVTPPPARY